MNRHAAQWALPGGRVDPGETAEQTALRELDEELGVRLPPDAVLGRLDDYATRSGYVITPVVVWGGAGLELRPNPDEVAHAYRIGSARAVPRRLAAVRRHPRERSPGGAGAVRHAT